MSAMGREFAIAHKTYPNWLDYAGYGSMHVLCLGAFWTGVSWQALVLCAVTYTTRMFGLMAGYHRYFSHRAFKTSRAMQFVLALLGTLGVQKGVLWWASHHRHHHRYSDTAVDVHSPMHRSFLYSHSGWFLDVENRSPDYTRVSDFMKYPELVWLDRFDLIPVVIFAGAIAFFFGWQGLFWGFFISTVLIWHGIHAIGSFGHRIGGYRRFATTDNSRNKWFIAVMLLGEGWHNNHHFYPSSARQGFVWWEIDVAYYVLKVMSWCGLVWDLRTPPRSVLRADPQSQEQVRRFERWVQDFRAKRMEAVDALASDGTFGGGLEVAALLVLKQKLELQMDAFQAAAIDCIVSSPEGLAILLDSLERAADEAMGELALASEGRTQLRHALTQVAATWVAKSAFASFLRQKPVQKAGVEHARAAFVGQRLD